MFVLLLGVVAGTLAANTLGEALFNLMFEGLFGGLETLGQGTSRIDFSVSPLLTYLALPAALLGCVSWATTASSHSISDASISTLNSE
jgi:putative ABC transport system permease protein